MEEKSQRVACGVIICGMIIVGFYLLCISPGQIPVNNPDEQNISTYPTGLIPVDDTVITITSLPNYAVGDFFTISGTTTLPSGELLDIAVTKEPFHFTKCEPNTFCGFKTYSTTVKSGTGGGNSWSVDLNTTGFTQGGYDIWVVARNSPNASEHAGLILHTS